MQGQALVPGLLTEGASGMSWEQGSKGRAGNSLRKDSIPAEYRLVFWREGGREGGGGRSRSVPGTLAGSGGGGNDGQGARIEAAGLTRAHADLAVGRGAEVAEKALVRVAGVALSAQLAQLLGTHAAAAAAVQHQADAGRAARRRGRALALAAAVLAGGGLRGGGGGQPGARPSGRRRALPFPAASLPPSAAAARVSVRLPGCRGRTGARRRNGRDPGRRQTWSGRCGRRVAVCGGDGRGARRGRRDGGSRARAGGGGLDAPGCRFWSCRPGRLPSGWRRSVACGWSCAGCLLSEGKSCCVRLGRAARGFYTLRAAPARQ